MAATTVIDQLIVRLGLDPRDFSKGQKQAAADTVKLEGQVRKSSEGMSRSLLGLTGKLLGVATVAIAVKKAADFVSDLSVSVRQLGIDSANLGIAASELRNFQNVAEMMGGKAEDVTKTVGGLSKAIYDLAYNGQVSDSLIMLGRLGVQFQDSTGGMREFKDIVLDTQTAIQQQMKQGVSRNNAFQMLTQAGFDNGLAQAMLDGNVADQLKRQEQRRQVTPEAVDAARKWEQSATNRDQTIEAGALGALPAASAAGVKANDAIAAASEVLSGQMSLGDAAHNAADAVRNFGGAIKDATEGAMRWLERKSNEVSPIATRGIRNNNPGNIKAVGAQARDAQGFRIFPTMQEGVAAADAQLDRYAKRGIKTVGDIVNTWAPSKDKNNVPKYIESIKNQTGLGAADEVTPDMRASFLAAMFRHESGAQAPDTGDVADLLSLSGRQGETDTPASPRAVAAAGNSKQTDITFEQVTINSPRADGESVANEFVSTTRRKLMAAHAETGIN